jgi:hypothetical protein
VPLPVTPALVGCPEGVLTQSEDLFPADVSPLELAEALMEDAHSGNSIALAQGITMVCLGGQRDHGLRHLNYNWANGDGGIPLYMM